MLYMSVIWTAVSFRYTLLGVGANRFCNYVFKNNNPLSFSVYKYLLIRLVEVEVNYTMGLVE